MGNPPFEDVSPIKNGGFQCYVSLPEGNLAQQQISINFPVCLGSLYLIPTQTIKSKGSLLLKLTIQIASMYGMFTGIYRKKSTVHVGKYNIHIDGMGYICCLFHCLIPPKMGPIFLMAPPFAGELHRAMWQQMGGAETSATQLEFC